MTAAQRSWEEPDPSLEGGRHHQNKSITPFLSAYDLVISRA